MTKPIYASAEHKTIVETYVLMCQEFAKEVSTKNKYNNYLDVVETILEYHNNYGSGIKENNWYDWLMIIPINMSVATNGFFAGIETKSNAAAVRAYKVILDQLLQETVKKLDLLQPTNE